eukprot:TRINITY_DN9493_c0_g2_i12.p1 TRINITY_DN9493_c0_g2~~TRINITY_DN9493_c0_g2_i12.p1  ORF type:complete len:487 (-),score=119.18 TRINITY_DN9493_c0_g2_i12:140-1600(-)
MSADTRKQPVYIDEIVELLYAPGKNAGKKKTLCCEPEKHLEICADLIDYTDFKPGRHSALTVYKELYRELNGEGRRQPTKIGSVVGRLKNKYELKERHLFIDDKKTLCKHLCLYNVLKDFFVPSKSEVQAIFNMVYKSGREWRNVKKRLMDMKMYSTASGALYEFLFDKHEERKEMKKVFEGSKKRRRASDSDEELYAIKCASKINIINKMRPIELDALEENKIPNPEPSDEKYPIKHVLSNIMDQSWIGPLLHMISAIPELALAALHLPPDKLNTELKVFVEEYWGRKKNFLAESEELCSYVKRLNRSEKNYKDLWQAWLLLSFRCKLTPLKEFPKMKILYEFFMGEIKKNESAETFLYLPLTLQKDTSLDIEMNNYLASHQFTKFPFLLAVLFNRENLSVTVRLPLSMVQPEYKLCHIVCCCVHESGAPHFFSYVLNPLSGLWFMVSEAEIHLVDIGAIDLSHIFFAIYRQKDPDRRTIQKLMN